MIVILSISMMAAMFSAELSDENSWTIFHNRKKIAEFSHSQDDEAKKITIPKRSVAQPGFLLLEYETDKNSADWKRTFVITDSNGKELKKVEGGNQLRVVNDDLEKMAAKGAIRILTYSVPSDPQQAAAVRVRRILLCSIHWR